MRQGQFTTQSVANLSEFLKLKRLEELSELPQAIFSESPTMKMFAEPVNLCNKYLRII
jgi:hypothetical protein